MAIGQKPWYLVNPKIAGKWMFIPLKMVLIGIDPYPYIYTYIHRICNLSCAIRWDVPGRRAPGISWVPNQCLGSRPTPGFGSAISSCSKPSILDIRVILEYIQSSPYIYMQ